MSKVSVLMPSRDEKYLGATIQDMVKKAASDVEVIAIVDGPTSYPVHPEYSNVKIINLPKPMGMRHGINLAASVATGKYLMKMDAHCLITRGYDEVLQEECEDNWVVVARRNELSPEWEITDTTPVDYFYMSSPWTSPQGYMRMCRWTSRDREKSDIMLDETMTFSGSMWFMSREHFFQRIKMMDEERFGQWSGEPEELSCKTWLGGGKVMINKKVTFAHMRKTQIGRPYHISWNDALKGLRESARYWSGDEWPDRIHDFDWLIDHFWPLPSRQNHCNGERYFWEQDWKEKYYKKKKVSITKNTKFFLETKHPIAKDSLDYLYPVGAIRDNSRRPKFNEKLRKYPGSVLDLGCAGGAFVKDCVDEGRIAIGLEGSDFNKSQKKFEWATIPDNLFTCDLTKPFIIHTGDKKPYQFDIITAWEFFEHIEKKDLPQLFTNIRNHLVNGGLVFASISHDRQLHEKYNGIDLHRTVEARSWWVEQFRLNGFIEDQEIAGHFAGRWVRDGRLSDKFVFKKHDYKFETPLCRLAFEYGSDKGPQILHNYTPFYYDFFKDKKDRIKKILEIGVGDAEEMAWTGLPGYQKGASLRMWRDFFPNAQIFGADIEPRMMFKTDRIQTFLCDQSKEEDLKNLVAKIGSDIDIVIDDGSHKPDHQVFSCRVLMPLLKKDVIYIIEDVGHPEIAERLPEYECEISPFKVRARRDDRLLIVRNKNA